MNSEKLLYDAKLKLILFDNPSSEHADEVAIQKDLIEHGHAVASRV